MLTIRSDLSALLILGLLFCGLALLEFPELLTLTDDASNNFTFAGGASREVAPSIVPERARVPVIPVRVAVAQFSERPFGPLLPSAIPVEEALHFFCLLRT
jgi:hypothetical protein